MSRIGRSRSIFCREPSMPTAWREIGSLRPPFRTEA